MSDLTAEEKARLRELLPWKPVIDCNCGCWDNYGAARPSDARAPLDVALLREAYWQTHSTAVIRQIHPEYRESSDHRADELLAEYAALAAEGSGE